MGHQSAHARDKRGIEASLHLWRRPLAREGGRSTMWLILMDSESQEAVCMASFRRQRHHQVLSAAVPGTFLQTRPERDAEEAGAIT